MPPGLAEKLGLEGAQPAPLDESTVGVPPVEGVAVRPPAPGGDSPWSTFGKVAANETSFGGSPGATARGAQAAGWMQNMFGGEAEQIPREYTRSGSTDERAAVEQNTRDDLAASEAANPRAALAGKGVALANHAMLASGVPMAGLPQAIGAGGLMGSAEGAVRAYNANEDIAQGAGEGGLTGAATAGVLHEAAPFVRSAAGWIPKVFGSASRALRGRQVAGSGENIEKSAADLRRAGIPATVSGIGQAAEKIGLPKATKVQPMSTHDFADAAQGVRDVEKVNTDAAAAAASAGEGVPPEALRRQATMLPPPNGEAPVLQPGGGGPLEASQNPALRARATTLRNPRTGETADANVPERAPVDTAESRAATQRPRGKVSKAEVAKALADRRAQLAGRVDPDAAAGERAISGMEKRLENQPEHLTPEQALAIRRGLDKASGFRPGEVVVPGRKEAVQGGGHAVREQLRTAMSETPHGEAFNASQARASKAAALQELAKRASQGAAHRALGTGAGAAMLGGGLEAAHGAMGAAHAAPGMGTLATAALTGTAAAFARHYGADMAATALKGAEKLTSPLAHPEVLTPGQTAGMLDIWSVKEKRKNETDPEYRKQQRRKAAESE